LPLPVGEVSTREKRVVDVAPAAGPQESGQTALARARAGKGPSHAGGVRALLWVGCAQADGGSLRPGDAPGWHRAAGRADVRTLGTLGTLGTMTADLLALADWLTGLGIQVLAMESTGGYWRPAYHLLAEGRQILLVHPQHLQTVPGRKTDVKDAEGLADPARATACSRPASSQLPPAPTSARPA
jgi:Transposase